MLGKIKSDRFKSYQKVEVFNPLNQRVCEMPDLMPGKSLIQNPDLQALDHYDQIFPEEQLFDMVQCVEISCVTGRRVRDGWEVRLSKLQ